jgi:tRNA threonylcarbamoyl adenosine modification protein YeaZ
LVSDPPLILAFDTSAARCAGALVQGETVLAQRDEPMDRGQAERLLPMLEELLADAGHSWPDVKAIAVCTGPGNFTGLRLAVAAARGLALALDIPAVGVSRFEAAAEGHAGTLMVSVEERRGSVLAQAFSDGTPLGTPVAALGVWPEQANHIDGNRTDPIALAHVAARRLHGPVPRPAPLYLRPADAAPPAEAPPRILDDA